jgi:DNA invertase Pin-like site-specific DNA recombinase
MSDLAKITAGHRQRRAVVYVRQSTPGQVERNTESSARQYALAERAVELGWPRESVVIVDEDTGHSAAWARSRIGFRELVAEVGLGHVGVILALEVSRLARSSADWHQLLDLCALTGTLICDGDGIYSPGEFNDRLLLGLKGTMSEAELHLIRARLRGGIENKARRGELRLNLPIGLDRNPEGRIQLTPDEQVRATIERVYTLWRRCSSARQVVAEIDAEQQLLRRRTVGEQRVRWEPASFGAVRDLLTNPSTPARSSMAAPASARPSTRTARSAPSPSVGARDGVAIEQQRSQRLACVARRRGLRRRLEPVLGEPQSHARRIGQQVLQAVARHPGRVQEIERERFSRQRARIDHLTSRGA